MKGLAGYNFNIICGYKGTADFPVAMERGEIPGIWTLGLVENYRREDVRPVAAGSSIGTEASQGFA
jgi:hypothetical protein